MKCRDVKNNSSKSIRGEIDNIIKHVRKLIVNFFVLIIYFGLYPYYSFTTLSDNRWKTFNRRSLENFFDANKFTVVPFCSILHKSNFKLISFFTANLNCSSFNLKLSFEILIGTIKHCSSNSV